MGLLISGDGIAWDFMGFQLPKIAVCISLTSTMVNTSQESKEKSPPFPFEKKHPPGTPGRCKSTIHHLWKAIPWGDTWKKWGLLEGKESKKARCACCFWRMLLEKTGVVITGLVGTNRQGYSLDASGLTWQITEHVTFWTWKDEWHNDFHVPVFVGSQELVPWSNFRIFWFRTDFRCHFSITLGPREKCDFVNHWVPLCCNERVFS